MYFTRLVSLLIYLGLFYSFTFFYIFLYLCSFIRFGLLLEGFDKCHHVHILDYDKLVSESGLLVLLVQAKFSRDLWISVETFVIYFREAIWL